MQTGAITSYLDVAQLVLYAFWAFFFGLCYYLLKENHREGYPMDNGGRGIIGGWPTAPEPKPFKLADGRTTYSPNPDEPAQHFSGQAVHPWSGGPIEPVGNPLTAGVGPGAWADRDDHPECDYLGRARVRPLRAMPGYGVSDKGFDPRGAQLAGADGQVVGTVVDLWVDSSDVLFRYLQVKLADGSREVLVPWNFARIHRDKPIEVYALYARHFAGVPAIKAEDTITVLEEEKIMAYFGAGLLYADEKRTEPLI